MEEKKKNQGKLAIEVNDLFPELTLDTQGELNEEAPREPEIKKRTVKRVENDEDALISCLRNETIYVRYIPRESGLFTNPKHEFAGNIAPNAKKSFTVPMQRNGTYVNVLTNSEKAFLEEYMGLEPNALSIYQKKDNYWDNYMVHLGKEDKVLNLNDPNHYIDYKVLLANDDFIAPSLDKLREYPKATYKFVIVNQNEELKSSNNEISYTMQAYMALGSIEKDAKKLSYIIKTMDGRVASGDAKDLLPAVNRILSANPKLFLNCVQDPYIDTKILIGDAVRLKVITKNGDYYYMKEDNTPLCEKGQEPTLNSAAKYLNSPKHQELKLAIEAKIENAE